MAKKTKDADSMHNVMRCDQAAMSVYKKKA